VDANRQPDFWVRLFLFPAWILGLIGIVGVGQQPFTTLIFAGACLLIASGVALWLGGTQAMSRLNERYSPWQRPVPHRLIAGGLIVIGAFWIAFTVAAS
jgi:uncharacterized membrane protein